MNIEGKFSLVYQMKCKHPNWVGIPRCAHHSLQSPEEGG
jgi:hypothetical protein